MRYQLTDSPYLYLKKYRDVAAAIKTPHGKWEYAGAEHFSCMCESTMRTFFGKLGPLTGQDSPYLLTNDPRALLSAVGTDLLVPLASWNRLLDVAGLAHSLGVEVGSHGDNGPDAFQLVQSLIRHGAEPEHVRRWDFSREMRIDARLGVDVLLTALSNETIRRKWLMKVSSNNRCLATEAEVEARGFQVDQDVFARVAKEIDTEDPRLVGLGQGWVASAQKNNHLACLALMVLNSVLVHDQHAEEGSSCMDTWGMSFGEAVDIALAKFPGLLQPAPRWAAQTVESRRTLHFRELLHRAGYRCTAVAGHSLVVLYPSDESFDYVMQRLPGIRPRVRRWNISRDDYVLRSTAIEKVSTTSR